LTQQVDSPSLINAAYPPRPGFGSAAPSVKMWIITYNGFIFREKKTRQPKRLTGLLFPWKLRNEPPEKYSLAEKPSAYKQQTRQGGKVYF